MFIKQLPNNSSITKNVKFVLAATAIVASLSTPTLASAKSLIENVEVVSVAFPTSLTKTDAGIEKVYAMLETKAAAACKNEDKIRYSAYDSVAHCVSSLMNQFVEDADMSELTRLHTKNTIGAPKTKFYAQN